MDEEFPPSDCIDSWLNGCAKEGNDAQDGHVLIASLSSVDVEEEMKGLNEDVEQQLMLDKNEDEHSSHPESDLDDKPDVNIAVDEEKTPDGKVNKQDDLMSGASSRFHEDDQDMMEADAASHHEEMEAADGPPKDGVDETAGGDESKSGLEDDYSDAASESWDLEEEQSVAAGGGLKPTRASSRKLSASDDLSCEIPDEEDEDDSKGRFNLRKRSQASSNVDDYGSDYYDQEHDEDQMSKRLKLSFSKKTFRRQRPYTNEAVKLAVKMVQSKKMNLQEASREFKIPRTSLHNFLQAYKKGRRIGMRTISPGLTKQEENEMVSLVMKLSRCGKRYSHNELRFLVQYYLISNDRPVFKSGTLPTMGWIAGLVERQQELLKAKSKKNTKVALEDVEEWQHQIEDYLINDWDLDISEMFSRDNASRIFCFNAVRYLINSPGENAENKPTPVKKEPGVEDDKADVEVGTVLGMSADGMFLDPLIIIPGSKRDTYSPIDRDDLKIVFNKTCRVDEEVGMRVVRDFDEYVTSRGIPKPVVYFVNDKHDLAHFSVIEYCWENQIIIVCLPPKTTRTMTPFEISIWPKIRATYANLWKSEPKSSDNKISIRKFVELFGQAWDSVKNPKVAIRGFIKSGLMPFNVPFILKEPTSELLEQQLQLQHQIEPKKPTKKNIKKQPPKKQSSDNHAQSPASYDSGFRESSERFEANAAEERSQGKLEGIEMCLRAIESFIPPDIFPVWNERGADYRGRCELAFKLWRSVSLLLKAGCAMASIQQMADGFFNPFGADFSSTASFFQKPLSQVTPAPSSSSSRSGSPGAFSSPPIVRSNCTSNEKPKTKKLKINKSIYSRSKNLPFESVHNRPSTGSTMKSDTQPFVKLYQNPFAMQEEMYRNEEF